MIRNPNPLLHYSTTPLLHYSTTTLLHYSTTPLLHYSTIPLFHYSTTPLFHYSTIPLLHYSTIPLFQHSVCLLIRYTAFDTISTVMLSNLKIYILLCLSAFFMSGCEKLLQPDGEKNKSSRSRLIEKTPKI